MGSRGASGARGYINFLASPELSDTKRGEIIADIKAVNPVWAITINNALKRKFWIDDKNAAIARYEAKALTQPGTTTEEIAKENRSFIDMIKTWVGNEKVWDQGAIKLLDEIDMLENIDEDIITQGEKKKLGLLKIERKKFYGDIHQMDKEKSGTRRKFDNWITLYNSMKSF